MIGWHLSRATGLLVGFLYPAYMSFKAIETEAKDDDTQWLTYWTVFSFFNVFEFLSDTIISWIPFYYELKLGFVAWLFLPQTMGAEFLYKTFVQPFLQKHEVFIDKELKDVQDRASEKIGQAVDVAKDRIGEEIAEQVGEVIGSLGKKKE